MTLSVIFYPYHVVRAILSIPFCPMPFCPYTILSIPFCPYHFVRYHFVLEPCSAQATVSKGLAQGPYMAARAGVEPTTLRLRVIDLTIAPPRPTIIIIIILVKYTV